MKQKSPTEEKASLEELIFPLVLFSLFIAYIIALVSDFSVFKEQLKYKTETITSWRTHHAKPQPKETNAYSEFLKGYTNVSGNISLFAEGTFTSEAIEVSNETVIYVNTTNYSVRTDLQPTISGDSTNGFEIKFTEP